MYILPYNKIVCWVYFCTFVSGLFKMNFVTRKTHRAIPRLLLDESLNVHTCIFVPTLCIRFNVFSICVCLLCCITFVIISCCSYFILSTNQSFQNTNLMHNSFTLQQYICYTTLLNMFRAACCSSSGGPIVSPQPLVSSPSVSSRTVCGWRADCSCLTSFI